MERIKLKLPESFSFETIIPIRITDVNYGNHVGNDAILTLLHEARMQYLQQYAASETNFFGAGLIMADVVIEYKRELKYGNNISIKVKATDFDRIGFDIFYCIEIIDANSPERTLAVKAKTGMICFDYQLGKKVAVPKKAIEDINVSPI